MNSLKRSLLAAVLIAATALAYAQPVNRVPALGVTDSAGATQVNTEGLKATYSAISTGLVPAASATDVMCIAGSASKTIRVVEWSISGTAGTLVTLPIFIAKRASVDTGGTPAAGNALPVAAKNDSTFVASTATLVAYTANPTITDASPGLIRAGTLTLPVTTAGTSSSRLIFNFGFAGSSALVLRGAAQQACVNLSGISVSSGLLASHITWTEE